MCTTYFWNYVHHIRLKVKILQYEPTGHWHNRIGGAMMMLLASIMGSSPGRVKLKTIKLVFVASGLSTQH